MRIMERDPRQRGLTTIYIPQEPRRVMPDELSEEIVLVHPAQPFGSMLHQVRFDSVNGAVGVTVVNGTTVPDDHYFWVHGGTASHDDATDRRMELRLRDPAVPNNIIVAQIFLAAAGQAVVLGRSLLVPPGWHIQASVGALGAGNVLSLRLAFLDLLAGELSPPL